MHPLDNRHIAYKIKCNQWPMSYISRLGHVRMSEHGRALKNSDKNSVSFQYFETTGRTFDLKNPNILDTESSQFKREFSEKLHIDSTNFTLNRKTDIH